MSPVSEMQRHDIMDRMQRNLVEARHEIGGSRGRIRKVARRKTVAAVAAALTVGFVVGRISVRSWPG